MTGKAPYDIPSGIDVLQQAISTYERLLLGIYCTMILSSSLYDKTEWDDPESEDEVVNVIYVDQMGKETRVRGKVGDNILYLAHRYSIGIEGACDAKVACSTCHVYVDEDSLAKLEEMELSEEDMLDAAPFLKPSSRLGCQIILRKDLDGIRITLPLGTKNAYVDGHTPHTH